MIWTPDRIRALAPDENTWERARRLGHPPLWRLPAGNETAVWGECKGAGGAYYQTAVALNGPAYRCSCPVKRLPCKHALALLLLLFQYPDHFRVTPDEPGWVAQWRNALEKRLAAKARREDSPEKTAQREKKRDKRMDTMAAGISELDAWLRDLVRQGIAAAESQPPAFWEQIAARMVDAKLGSIARRLRLLAFPATGRTRHEHIIAEISEMFLLAEGFRRLDRLPEGMQMDLLGAAGLAQRKDDLEGQPSVSDHWLVLGIEEGSEEQLQYRRVWLAGKESRRFALLLDFAWGDTAFAEQWPLGAAFHGELQFYPSAYPLRAVAQPMQPAGAPFEMFAGYATLAETARAWAQALALNPWLPQMPAVLDAVVPVFDPPNFVLTDGEKHTCPLLLDEEAALRLLASSGGHPLRLFGEWGAGVFRALSVAGRQVVTI